MWSCILGICWALRSLVFLVSPSVADTATTVTTRVPGYSYNDDDEGYSYTYVDGDRDWKL